MPANHLTHHYDNARTGWNPHETALTVASVRRSFHLHVTQPVDGQIYAQPLVATGVVIPGHGTHDVVYVATEGATVYAFDAASAGPPLWQRRLVPPGEAPVAPADVGHCGNIAPRIGITGTPVIERATDTLYVVAKTKSLSGAVIHQRLHALHITTGADQPGSPVEIQATVAGNGAGHDGSGHIPFDPRWHSNRPALLSTGHALYAGFGSHCDLGPYHGWIIHYDLPTLRQHGAFNASPEALTPAPPHGFADRGGAVWQSGSGPAIDGTGDLYVATGNGPFNAHAGGRDYGDSIVRLRPDLTVADYFTPFNQDALNAQDRDLGSGGVMLLPPQPGPHPALLVACGKEGTIYLIDRADMGRYRAGPGGTDRVVQRLPHAVGGVWGAPAFYHGAAGPVVYYCGHDDHLKAFRLAHGALTPAGQSPDTFTHGAGGDGGAIPSVSSNGGAAGSGIVWAVRRSNPLTLFAYDADDVTVKLFEGDAGPWTNPGGGPFLTPTVANGHVYVGTGDRLAVFGL